MWWLLGRLAAWRWTRWIVTGLGLMALVQVKLAQARRKAVEDAEERRENEAARWAKELDKRVRETEGRLADEADGSGDPRRVYLDFLRERKRVRPSD